MFESDPRLANRILLGLIIGVVAGVTTLLVGSQLPWLLSGAQKVSTAAFDPFGQVFLRLLAGLEIISEIMTKIVHFALKLAPFAVPAMIYSVIVKIGFDILAALAVFVVGCAATMLLHLFGTMSIWLKLWTAYGPLRFFRQIRTVLLTAFSTSSSAATLPVALATAQGTLGLRPSVVGFVLPLIAGLLVAFGIPPEGIGIILGVDRLLDMTRTMVNVGSDMVICAVVDARVRVAEERAANRTAAA